MEEACAVDAGSCALASTKALRMKTARASGRVMGILRGTAAPRLSKRAQLARAFVCPSLHSRAAGLRPADSRGRAAVPTRDSIQKILPVQRVPLRRTEARIPYDAPQLFFGCAVVDARRADDVFLKHHGAHVVAAETQAHLADFQSLRHPTGLHIQKIREIEPRNRQHFQIFNRRCFIPAASAERGIRWLETPRDERGKSTRLLLQIV